jgi:crossover junction endodeoxyribonuclease RuvC
MGPVDAPAKPLRVLGVDPGTHLCGWGVVERVGARLVAVGYGVVRAPRQAPVETRLAAVAAGLREVVARHAPDAAAVEEAFYGRDVRAAIRIGEGRGAALVVLAQAGVPVAHYTNNVVKRSVAGGRASKERVLAMTRAVLGLASISGPLDASDALALAICHHHRAATPGSAASDAGRPAPRFAAALEALRAAERARRARTAPRRPPPPARA